ncbi:hypothetical protein [Aeromonas enteropelogenes]|uniref:hypothetical protein n=1 Tax=Aeromonas enteropelogenes TaxID=29489 RepID=UPI003BA0C40F
MQYWAFKLVNCDRWRQWLLAASLIWGHAHAMTVEADITGESLRWVSAQSSFDDGVTPSVWDTPPQLVPASAFVPGASTLDSMNISLVGPEGRSVPLSLALLGMEYSSPEATGLIADGRGGASVSFNGGLVQVQGRGLGDKQVTLGSEVTPFTHARPVFSLGSNSTILQAFKDAKAIPGVYITQVSLPQVYEYVRGGVRIRYTWALPLSIYITYAPSVLNDITLVSPTLGHMTTRYYHRGGVQYVAGNALYNGTATGYFTNGLRLRMKTGNVYHMVGDDDTRIPFSVTCTACEHTQLVDNKGDLVFADLTTTGTTIARPNSSTISFVINIDFADVDISTLRTGAYHGAFSMLFEPDI